VEDLGCQALQVFSFVAIQNFAAHQVAVYEHLQGLIKNAYLYPFVFQNILHLLHSITTTLPSAGQTTCFASSIIQQGCGKKKQ